MNDKEVETDIPPDGVKGELGSLILVAVFFTIPVAAFIIVVILAINLWSSAKALPVMDRFKYIDIIAEDLDYKSLGIVISEEREESNGIERPTYFYVDIAGEDIYSKVKERMYSLPYLDCENNKCSWDGIEVNLRGTEDSEMILIEINDSYNGKFNPLAPEGEQWNR